MTTKTTVKQAKINCPHCGLPITVKQTVTETTHEQGESLFDDCFKAMDDAFKKIFGK